VFARRRRCSIAPRSTVALRGLIQLHAAHHAQGTRELMRHHDVGVICDGRNGTRPSGVWLGQPATVRSRNVPALNERTADVRKAVADISREKLLTTKRFAPPNKHCRGGAGAAKLALEECRRQGAYFFSPEEMKKVGAS